MMHPLDPWRAAKQLLDQRRVMRAVAHVDANHRKMIMAGDAAGAAVWKQIADALDELIRLTPRDGEARH